MSVFKRPGQETYSYDFQTGGVRFTGNTGATTKREAEREEQKQREAAKAVARRSTEPLTVGVAFARYFMEVGSYHANSDTTLSELTWLEEKLGKTTLLSSIGAKEVTSLIAKRRGTGVKPATVNRSVTVRLRAVMSHARKAWEENVKTVQWSDHLLKEPQERVRELSAVEEVDIFTTLRKDFHPIIQFAILSGCRRQELLDMKWRDIDFAGRNFTVVGKGEKTRTNPLSTPMLTLLQDLRVSLGFVPAQSDHVFTYIVRRANKEAGRSRGERLPIELHALKSAYKRAVTKAGVVNFRFHDLRHTAASRLLRSSGNLRIPQRLLGHSKIETTLKYAHVTDDDIRAAMEAVTPAKNPESGDHALQGNDIKGKNAT